MLEWFAGAVGGQIIVDTYQATVGQQIQGIIKPRYQRFCNAIVGRPRGELDSFDSSQDLQRLLCEAYIVCGRAWLNELPGSPEHEDSQGTLSHFKTQCLVQLEDFEARATDRCQKFDAAASVEQTALETLLEAIPEVQIADFGYGYITERLTTGFEILLEQLLGGLPIPEIYKVSLRAKDESGDHSLFGRKVLHQCIEYLKDGKHPEASKAFDYHMFAILRDEITNLTSSEDVIDVRASIDAVKLEILALGVDAKESMKTLDHSVESLNAIELAQRQLLGEVVELRNTLNLIRLDRKPQYEVSERESFSEMRFDQRRTRFIGREAELDALNSFLCDLQPLRWWQISGDAGQGKSRLALELVDTIATQWDAGFLSVNELEKTDWNSVRVVKPTLIVIDYLSAPGKTRIFTRAFKTLAERVVRGDTRLQQVVRFLILEREGYEADESDNRGRGLGWYEQVETSAQAVIRSTEHEYRQTDPITNEPKSSPLKIQDLTPSDMVSIANSWRAYLSGNRRPEYELEPLTEVQKSKLVEIMEGQQYRSDPKRQSKKAWRPLFAMMIGQYVSELDRSPQFSEINIWQILDKALQVEREEYWPRADEEIVEYSEPIWNLACLCTMIGQYEHSEAQTVFARLLERDSFDAQKFFGPFDMRQFAKANTLLGYRTLPSVAAGSLTPLLGREPDVFGEFLVLNALNSHFQLDALAAHKRMVNLVTCAIELAPEAFVQFLVRVAEDFGNTEAAKALFATKIPTLDNIDSSPMDLSGAAYFGFTGIVYALINIGADVNTMKASGGNPITFAAQEGHAEIVDALLEARAAFDMPDPVYGIFPLLMAAENGHLEIVTALLSAGADINLTNPVNGSFPLLMAAQNGHLEIVDALLKAKADVNLTNLVDGSFPLLLAAQNGHLKVVTLLLEARADINMTDPVNGTFPLLMASQEGHYEIVTELLKAGADINLTNPVLGSTPLLLAVQNGHLKSVNALLAAHVDFDAISSKKGSSPLIMAAQNGHLEIVDALLDAGADFEVTNPEKGSFPLGIAAQEGHLEIVDALLGAGADCNRIDPARTGTFPLLLAAQTGHVEIVDALLKAEANFEMTSPVTGAFPILLAAEFGHLEIVLALHKAGAGVNSTNPLNGTFPLMMAAQNGHLEVVDALLKAEADINLTNPVDGAFPILLAAENGHLEIVDTLFKAGADVNLTSPVNGSFPLLVAAQNGHLEVVDALLKTEAKVDMIEPAGGAFPLVLAAQNGYPEVVKALLEAKANFELISPVTGAFPLLSAAENGHLEIVIELLEAGANCNMINPVNGSFPLQMAAQNGHSEVVATLLEFRADARQMNESVGIGPAESAILGGHSEVINLLAVALDQTTDDLSRNAAERLRLLSCRGQGRHLD